MMLPYSSKSICLMPILLLLAQPAIAQQWKPGADSQFEVGTQLRPWTMRDEGMETIIENCRSMAGVNSIYLVAVMHQEHRPYQAKKFPHNPKRSTFMAEDSTVAWSPDIKRYGRIKPALSEYDWIRETDWLRLLVDECRDRGMAVGAEVSHFPIPQGELANHPEWRQRDIFGEPRNKKQFCLHQPDVRHYLLALFGDLAANYDLDYIQTCQYLYPSQDIDEGGSCFCEHCIAAAKKTGFDLEAAIPVLRENKNAQPQRRQWEQFRFDSVTKLYQDLAETIHKEDRDCQLRLNDVFSWRRRDPRQRAMDIGAIAEHLDSIVNQDHDEQFGAAKADFEARAEWIAMNRKHLGFDKALVSGIAPRMNATPELVKEGIRVAIQLPARINGLALKHYDGASFSLMRAFKQGMIDAGVRGLIPTLGKEVEEMELDGYVPFDEELAEEWGVRTTGTGTASYVFELPSGLYDVRITYFDAPSGQSKVRLEIDGKETASFTMNEDCDCWRWRRFENISIKRGDRVCLSGAADGKEQAMLDHIEFIPTAD